MPRHAQFLSRIMDLRTWADAIDFNSNSFFLIPVFHFPWSEKGREARLAKVATRNTQAEA